MRSTSVYQYEFSCLKAVSIFNLLLSYDWAQFSSAKGSYFDERNGAMALIHNSVIRWIAGTPIGEDKQRKESREITRKLFKHKREWRLLIYEPHSIGVFLNPVEVTLTRKFCAKQCLIDAPG